MRYRQPYSLYRRKDSPVFYYRTYDSAGRRTAGRSTGFTKKTAAKRYCDDLMRRGHLVPGSAQSLEVYAADWWDWDRCAYVAEMRDRGRITKAHADNQRRLLRLHILPHIGSRRIDELSTAVVEDWARYLMRESGLSSESIRKCVVCLSKILSEAVRRGELHANPCDSMRSIEVVSQEKGILSLVEVQALLHPDSWHWVWRGDLKHYAINLVAAATGLRRNEIRQLRVEDIIAQTIVIRRETAKARRKRVVPIPKAIRSILTALANAHGSQWLFPGRTGLAPLSGEMIPPQLYRALERSGVSEEERRARGITFHSWRHFATTYMQSAGVNEGILRSFIGHSSKRMTAHYSHFDEEHYRQVTRAQAGLLGGYMERGD